MTIQLPSQSLETSTLGAVLTRVNWAGWPAGLLHEEGGVVWGMFLCQKLFDYERLRNSRMCFVVVTAHLPSLRTPPQSLSGD